MSTLDHLQSYYRFYWDDFGLIGNTFSLELPIKITPTLSITPFERVYAQQGVDFFKPFGEHNTEQQYYTSDYDLSTFHSYKSGVSIRHAPFSKKRRRTFKEIEIRYAFYKRSDGLTASIITAFINLEYERRNKKNQ